MITIFKKVRQKLLSENKTGRYFKYAIGEIILVVIGILVALQINNWNELRKQKLVEIDILEGIRNDILEDTIDLNANIRNYKKQIKSDSIRLDHLSNKREKDKKIINLLALATIRDNNLILHDSHFQEAKLKGLAIISNKNLRITISRLYEFEYKNIMLAENSMEIFNQTPILKKELGQYLGYKSGRPNISDTSYNKLLADDSVLFFINQGRNIKKHLLRLHLRIHKSTLKVVDSINKELDFLKE